MTNAKPFLVLVTRPVHQAHNLTRMIESRGWQAVPFPVLEIVPRPRSTNEFEMLEKLQYFDCLIFVSANAVNFALQANNGKITPFKQCKIASVGKATARALESAGLVVDWVPETGFDSEALLTLPYFHEVEGRSFLIVRGEGGREKLADTLRERGATVEYWEVYQRIRPQSDVQPVVDLLKRGELSLVTVSSGEALRNLVDMLSSYAKPELISVPLVVISERMKYLAEDIGFKRIALASGPDDEAIVQKVTTVCNGE